MRRGQLVYERMKDVRCGNATPEKGISVDGIVSQSQPVSKPGFQESSFLAFLAGDGWNQLASLLARQRQQIIAQERASLWVRQRQQIIAQERVDGKRIQLFAKEQ